MPIPALIIPLEKGGYYHIYNRGNNKDKLFTSSEDFEFFLRKYFQYLNGYVTTYAYCLIPNHFHFLIQVKEEHLNGSAISNQFRKLFISHARRMNYKERRTGCLLTRNYRREKADSDSYLRNLVLYIHFNPVKHGLTENIIRYSYSSFGEYLGLKTGEIPTNEVLEWFDGIEEFLIQHHIVERERQTEILIEDDE